MALSEFSYVLRQCAILQFSSIWHHLDKRVVVIPAYLTVRTYSTIDERLVCSCFVGPSNTHPKVDQPGNAGICCYPAGHVDLRHRSLSRTSGCKDPCPPPACIDTQVATIGIGPWHALSAWRLPSTLPLPIGVVFWFPTSARNGTMHMTAARRLPINNSQHEAVPRYQKLRLQLLMMMSLHAESQTNMKWQRQACQDQGGPCRPRS